MFAKILLYILMKIKFKYVNPKNNICAFANETTNLGCNIKHEADIICSMTHGLINLDIYGQKVRHKSSSSIQA